MKKNAQKAPFREFGIIYRTATLSKAGSKKPEKIHCNSYSFIHNSLELSNWHTIKLNSHFFISLLHDFHVFFHGSLHEILSDVMSRCISIQFSLNQWKYVRNQWGMSGRVANDFKISMGEWRWPNRCVWKSKSIFFYYFRVFFTPCASRCVQNFVDEMNRKLHCYERFGLQAYVSSQSMRFSHISGWVRPDYSTERERLQQCEMLADGICVAVISINSRVSSAQLTCESLPK